MFSSLSRFLPNLNPTTLSNVFKKTILSKKNVEAPSLLPALSLSETERLIGIPEGKAANWLENLARKSTKGELSVDRVSTSLFVVYAPKDALLTLLFEQKDKKFYLQNINLNKKDIICDDTLKELLQDFTTDFVRAVQNETQPDANKLNAIISFAAKQLPAPKSTRNCTAK